MSGTSCRELRWPEWLLLLSTIQLVSCLSIYRVSENEILKPKWVQLENLAESQLEDGFYQAYKGEESRIHRPGTSSETSSCSRIKRVPDDILGSDVYRKYTEAYGIPILGSQYVSDAALSRACYVVRFFFADRRDLRRTFYKAWGRVAIIGMDEKITALPEYEMLPKSYQGLRGLGGVPSVPVVAVGEEHLECDVSEDLFIRELTIGVVNIAMTQLSPRYDYLDRLQNQYTMAMASRMWEDTSSRLSYLTYIGEGVQSYFNVNGYADPPDGMHNNINLRQTLQEYDPGLTNLIVELLPCGNSYIHNCKGTEDLQVLSMNCPVQVWP